MARATTSLPVPVSPGSSTVASLSASGRSLGTSRIAAELPIRSSRRRRRRRWRARSSPAAEARVISGREVRAADRLGEVVDGAEPHRLDRVGGRGTAVSTAVGGASGQRADATQAPRSRQGRACAGRAARRPHDAAPPPARAPPRPSGAASTAWPRSVSASVQALADRGVVIDDQDSGHAKAPGRSRANTPPSRRFHRRHAGASAVRRARRQVRALLRGRARYQRRAP